MVATYYECPVCGLRDNAAYLTCHRPDCTDGRDQRVQAAHPAVIKRYDQDPVSHRTDELRYAREDEVLPEGWELASAYYQRKMRWLKWTVIFPTMLLLVIAVFLLFTHKAKASEWKTIPYFCHAMYGMPRNCDSVKSFANKFGQRAALWMARRCGALEADIEEAKACLKQH